MMKRKVHITCEGIKDSKSLDELIIIQGKLKILSKENADKLWNSIIEHGFCVPIFIWMNGKATKLEYNILDGTQRTIVLRAKQKEGWEIPPLPVIYIKAPTRKKAKAILLKIASQYGKINDAGFIEFTQDLDLSQITDINFDAFDVNIFLQDAKITQNDDEVPEVAEAITKPGDLWQLGKHKVLCGDSTKKEDVERLIDGKTSQLLFTSPPYSNMRDYDGKSDLSVENLIKFVKIFYPFCFYQVINLGLKRHKSEIVEYWNEYIYAAKEAGYKFLSWNVWNRISAKSIGQQKAMFPIAHEWIFVFGKDKNKLNKTKKKTIEALKDKRKFRTHRKKDGTMGKTSTGNISELFTQITTVLTLQTNSMVQSKYFHPATFPVQLPVEYILAMTQKNDIVSDPFLGSGSTLIACEKTFRICYGLEIFPFYCDVIINRYISWCKENNRDLEIKLNGKARKGFL